MTPSIKIALLAGVTSVGLNLLILAVFLPIHVGFQAANLVELTGWTFFAAIGAVILMIILQKNTSDPLFIFTLLAFIVFFISLIPIYLHAGILQKFLPHFLGAGMFALIVMHSTDSLMIYLIITSKYWARKTFH